MLKMMGKISTVLHSFCLFCFVCLDLFIVKLFKHACQFVPAGEMILVLCLFCLFLLLYVPFSTAMVIAGRSVHLTTLFPGQA